MRDKCKIKGRKKVKRCNGENKMREEDKAKEQKVRAINMKIKGEKIK
jgi:hypothetical protein